MSWATTHSTRSTPCSPSTVRIRCSPYHLVLGLVSRLTGLSIFTVFNMASVGNVVLLLVGLRMFTSKVLGRRHADFYAPLFILFL